MSLVAEEPTSSAEIIASIDDLLIQFLIRLPSKSLLRFKVVSKHWLFLIISPGFSLLRNHNSPCRSLGLFLLSSIKIGKDFLPRYDYVPFSGNKSATEFELKIPRGHRVRILQHFNGLLLLREKTSYSIYNPTTRESFALSLPRKRKFEYHNELGFGFDPRKSPYFTVVHLDIKHKKPGPYRIDVYSSETKTWRLFSNNIPLAWNYVKARINYSKGVYCNNSIHWMNDAPGDSLYYDLRDYSFKIMPVPPIMDKENDYRHNYYFGESCDCLHYIDVYNPRAQFWDMYELKRDYSEWFVTYKIDPSPVFHTYRRVFSAPYFDPTREDYHVSCVIRREKEGSLLVLRFGKDVILYNIDFKTLEKLHEFTNTSLEPRTEDTQYFENLNGLFESLFSSSFN